MRSGTFRWFGGDGRNRTFSADRASGRGSNRGWLFRYGNFRFCLVTWFGLRFFRGGFVLYGTFRFASCVFLIRRGGFGCLGFFAGRLLGLLGKKMRSCQYERRG